MQHLVKSVQCKMNALYVTVSIPLLLVFAGFNHAHGLTTFGKTNPQNQQPVVQGKHCMSQANCTVIKGTTCLRSYCLCGDNTHPTNGKCNAKLKGPKHLCQTDDECVDRAECLEPKEKMKPNNVASAPAYKVCQCEEGFVETPSGTCNGGAYFAVLPGLLLLSMGLVKFY